MSEYLGDQGFRLLEQFEPGPDGKIATTAYRCPGGKYTLGLGATEWETGEPVQKGQECTVDRAVELTGWSVRKFAAVVDEAVTQPISRNQRDALILMAYNVGPTAFKDSSVVHFLNEGRPVKEVAAAFGLWCKATSSGPEKGDLDDGYYRDVIGKSASGEHIWVGPSAPPPPGYAVVRDGDMFWATIEGGPNVPLGLKPVTYQRAFPGLLRRHLSEACLFLDLDWVQACRKQTVSITSHREWDPKDKRWEDRVRSKTELADVLPVASRYKLKAADAAPVPTPEPIIAPEPTKEAPPLPPKQEGAAVLSDTVETRAVEISPPANVDAAPVPLPPSPPERHAPSDDTGTTVRADSGAGAAGKPPSIETSAAPTLPPVVSPPKPPVVILPKSVNLDAIPYGDIRTDKGGKLLTDSKRFIGLLIVGGGSVLQILAARNIVTSTVGAVFFDMSRDPVIVSIIAGGIVWGIGVLTVRHGTKVTAKGMETATQVLV